jgi:hypothetical protein
MGGTPEVLFDSGNVFLSIATGLAIGDQHVYFEYSQTPGSFSIYSITKTGGESRRDRQGLHRRDPRGERCAAGRARRAYRLGGRLAATA